MILHQTATADPQPVDSHPKPQTPPPTFNPAKVPRSCQCMLMSATTSEDVEQLQKLVLHNPTTLNLLSSPPGAAGGAGAAGGEGADGGGAGGLGEGGSGAASEIRHFHYPCAKEDCALVVLALLKLGLLRKKVGVECQQPGECCFAVVLFLGALLRAFEWFCAFGDGV